MTPSFHRVRDLFDQTCELPADQQAAFVRKQAGGDEGLVREVMKLLGLAPQRDADKVQSTATDAPLQKLADAPKLDATRYVLEGEIDRGGMGAVRHASGIRLPTANVSQPSNACATRSLS